MDNKPIQKITVNGEEFEVLTASQRDRCMLKVYETIKLSGGKHLYIGNKGRGQLYKAAGYDVNQIDFAVPEPWLDIPENLKRWKSGDRAVWSYNGKARTFGEPVWDSEMLSKLKKLVNSRLKARKR